MDNRVNDPDESVDHSECSCCCEDVDSSVCSCCSCECDTECSSCYDSPTHVYTTSKLNHRVYSKFNFIEELSKSCENSSNHVLLNNYRDLYKKCTKLDKLNTHLNSNFYLGSVRSDYSSNCRSGPYNSKPDISSLHSKQLEQELLEIEDLLSDTNLESSSKAKYQPSYNGTQFLSDSNSYFNNSDSTTPNIKSAHDSRPSDHKGLDSWPSGFNTPKYCFTDSDYTDPDKLHSMLVSLDLYSYMYVVENVLDQRMKQELSNINVLS